MFSKIFWSQNGELVCIAAEESFYILRFHQEAVGAAATNKDLVSDDGIEDAFDVRNRFNDVNENDQNDFDRENVFALGFERNS